MSRNPFEEIERMFDRMSRQFEPFEEELAGGSVAVDVEDGGDEFVVTADLPGYDRGDIDVQLSGNRLTLSASRRTDEEFEEGDGRYIRRERRSESVSRSVSLPDEVDEEGTEAEYNNGVLTVRLPKAGDAGREIPIN